ncbi:Protein kinase domain-containing protein [Mycena sanguinolenta]|uniref:Protein kinase domain-containing protein n=1 Tax=Mycena sanguinolenta TaxID=230812 RepID=A0A8H6ZM03_9AGAR|nr:Protein kinase domain-containing protein [Mycena sanguinolenta]
MPISTPAPGASTHASRDSKGKETDLKSAHSALTSQTEEEDSTIGTAESYSKQLTEFLENNKDAIDSTKNALSAALTVTNIEEPIDAFIQTSKIIVSGLDILGKIHPFISIAAQAFKLVIEVDLTRRENDGKVLAVRLQMQDMIVMLFDLRDISKEKVGHLTEVMESIAKHITAARSACEEYQGKGLFSRMIKCKIYEDRLAKYAQLFADDKREVQSSLALYTADGVSEIKKQMQKLFRVLETDHEREVRGIIGNNEAQDYIGNEKLQQQLFAESEKFLKQSQLASERKLLQKELVENVDDVFKKHITRFNSQLQKQNNLILAALNSGPSTQISDPTLQEIWRAHRWSDPILGQHFVSGLHGHYKEELTRETDSRSQCDSERWVLEYIDIAPAKLIEAVDDDGSGFLSAEEINSFTAPKPEDWSLTDWIVFWVAGWHPTVAWYKEKIEAILPSQSTSLPQYVHSDNMRAANTYFASSAIQREVSDHQRIDHYIFPLLYLLLSHHRDTMEQAGREHSEFTRMSTSLDSIFEAVEWRIDVLKAMFEMNSLDVKEHFRHFSFGMFSSLYDFEHDEHDEQKNSAQDQNEQSPQNQVQDPRPIIEGGTGGEGGPGGKEGGAGGPGEATDMNLEDTKYFRKISGGVGGKGGKGGNSEGVGVGGIGGIGKGNKFRETRITQGWLFEPNPDVKIADLEKYGLDKYLGERLIAEGYMTVGDLLEATDEHLERAQLNQGRINHLKGTLRNVPPKK